ncbi:MAG: ketopantoate reductase family protein [Aquabacterium sp.]
MRIAIVGAGAIGGFIGARLALAGRDEVCALARGATLQALQAQGWRLRSSGALHQAPARAADSAAALGQQDLVVIAVKGPALSALAPQLAPLLGPQTVVLPAMNGVPWWFCQGLPGFEAPLDSVDPGGRIAAALPLAQVLGCVVHASAAMAEPGLVDHRMGQGLIVGEPVAGAPTARVDTVADALAAAGFDLTRSSDVRRDIWYKLWGNLTMNPVSALCGVTMDKLLGDPLVLALCSRAMREMAALGPRIGCTIDQTPEDRHVVTLKLGAFRTSMLQDADAGRPLELDSIIAAVCEIGSRLGVELPAIEAIFGLTRVWARQRGLYPV